MGFRRDRECGVPEDQHPGQQSRPLLGSDEGSDHVFQSFSFHVLMSSKVQSNYITNNNILGSFVLQLLLKAGGNSVNFSAENKPTEKTE